MKLRVRFLASALGAASCLSLMASPAFAHHSFAMFDPAKKVTLTGTVKEFQWTNPHVWLQLMVRNGAKDTEWSLEGPSVNMLVRGGWRAKSVKPGEKVEVLMNPRRDGSAGGSLITVKLVDGKVLQTGAGAPPPPRGH